MNRKVAMRAGGIVATIVAALVLSPTPVLTQEVRVSAPFPDAARLTARRRDAEARPLFQTTAPIAITLAANFDAVNRERKIGSTKTFRATLTVTGDDGVDAVPLQVNLRTRGHVRRQSGTCASVPLYIDFVKQAAKRTVFDGQNKLKLVVQCNDGPRFDQLVLLEHLAYRLHGLVTPHAFRVRLALVTYVDAKNGRTLFTRHAVFIEDDDDVAARMEGRAVDAPGLLFKDFDQESLTLMAVFQYMIGNPDYSIAAMHNVRTVETAAKVRHLIAWDFDVTGLVDPRYAVPSVQLRRAIEGVRVRSYLGPCRTASELEPTLAVFRGKQAEIAALVQSFPGLDEAERRKASDYLDEFFAVIGSAERVKRELVDGCRNGPAT